MVEDCWNVVWISHELEPDSPLEVSIVIKWFSLNFFVIAFLDWFLLIYNIQEDIANQDLDNSGAYGRDQGNCIKVLGLNDFHKLKLEKRHYDPLSTNIQD